MTTQEIADNEKLITVVSTLHRALDHCPGDQPTKLVGLALVSSCLIQEGFQSEGKSIQDQAQIFIEILNKSLAEFLNKHGPGA